MVAIDNNVEIIVELTKYKCFLEKCTALLVSANDESLSENNNNNNKENENMPFLWNDISSKLLLELYKEKREAVTNRKIRNLKKMWAIITEEMNAIGYNVTAVQAENKMKSLNRSYKNMISHNNKTGRDRVGCPYAR